MKMQIEIELIGRYSENRRIGAIIIIKIRTDLSGKYITETFSIKNKKEFLSTNILPISFQSSSLKNKYLKNKY